MVVIIYFMIDFYQEIPSSPFKVKVDPSHDAGKVRAEGPGLNKTGKSFTKLKKHICNRFPIKYFYVTETVWFDADWQYWQIHTCALGVEVGTPTHFTIYTKGAGKAKPEVHFAASGPGEAVRDFEIIDNHDYSYTVKYTALQQVL